MFLTFIAACFFQFRFAMAFVRAQEEALVFKRLQLRWQGLMLLTFFTTHVFQFRFAELSIIGTPNHPSFVMSWAFRHLEHRPRKVFKSKQCLSEPVAPMPFMQQGISIFHSVSSTCVYQLKSAWTSLSLF